MTTSLIILIITITVINIVILFVYRDTARKLNKSNYVLRMLIAELIATEHEHQNE